MAISVIDQFDYRGRKFLSTRDAFATISDMVGFREEWLPDMHDAFCLEDGNQYRYNISNSVDPVLGKWRLIDSSFDETKYYDKDETDKLLDDKVDKKDGWDLSENNFSDDYKNKIGTVELETESQDLSNAVNELNADYADVKQTIDLLNGEKTTPGSVRYFDSLVYDESTKYTDERFDALNKKKSIACDERPVYTEGETIEEDTITYKLDGVEYTIPADEIWFYYMEENDMNNDYVISANEVGLVQTIWIDRVPFSMMSFGLDMDEYVNKNKDVVSTYTGEEQDTSKIPNLASMKALQDLVINKTDIVDNLTSEDETKVLSAKQGKEIKTTLDDKLSITQKVEDAGKFVVVDEGGKLTLSDSAGMSAENVDYENESHQDCDNVKKALDKIFNKLYYEKPAITSFTMTPSTSEYEVGQSVDELEFTWSYSKDIKTQSLTDVTLTDETDRSATWTGSLKTSKTFTLTCSDGENTATMSKSISFKNKLYYGSSAIPETYNSEFILSLSNKQFATNYKGTFKPIIDTGEYLYFAYPASWGQISSVFIGGFETTMENCGNVAFTNASGGLVTYNVIKSGRSGLGSITVEIK